MSLSPDFTAKLLNWFDHSARILPWRNGDAYRVWLSETMLQQTQIDTVIPYYTRFLNAYPILEDLANAPLDDVLKLWEGLGYYSRARNLHHTARDVVTRFGGVFPSEVTELLTLKGIGRYTAGAIASMAYGKRAPILDGNVVRVFSRLFDLADDVTLPATQKKLWAMAEEHLPLVRVGDYNQALMQLGQLVCTTKSPACSACPVQAFCQAFAMGTVAQRPVKPTKTPTPHYDVVAGVVYNDDGQLLIAQRREDGLLGGLWEFAGGKQEPSETREEALQRELREELAIEVIVEEHLVSVKHAFTHFKITLHAYECRYVGAMPPYETPQAIECANWAWVSLDSLTQYAFGKADRAVIDVLRERPKRLL